MKPIDELLSGWEFCMEGSRESCRTVDDPCGPCAIVRGSQDTIATLRAALIEACEIGTRINEQAGAAGDEDDQRLAELRRIAEDK